ncbi:MAG: TIM barrel protein [Candidatus Micrarchaeota archaeon]|nr:TIM barrel protein [Candidatus Micrarchaeota archaeon]
MRFGPAGIPITCEGDNLEGLEVTARLGLRAYEVEFVRGVRMKADYARGMGRKAKGLDISLSCHCPYWINCAAMEKEKIARTIHNIMDTARVAHLMGAKVIVLHPAFYMDRPSSEVYPLVKGTIAQVLERMKGERIDDVLLGLETAGKGAQFGTIEENGQLSAELAGCVPVIDFAHVHARENGSVKGREGYERIFERVEKSFNADYLKHFHSHFSNIEYTKKGERRHLELGEGGPPFAPLAQVIKERGYEGTMICESPLLEQDAIRMQRIFEGK